MSRYAKANQSIEDLKALIEKDGSPYYAVENSKVRDDLSKIEVDTENTDYIGKYVMPGTETLSPFEMIGSGESAFPVAWCACGGDWEQPIAFVLYIGQKGELRAYIPSDGNAYNHKAKAAYGNNDEDPNWEEDPDDPRLRFDAEKLRASVAGRIMVCGMKVKGSSGVMDKEITFRQLIQSLKDFDDQLAAVMPQAKDAENPYWGIQYIWFDNGVLMLGQHDDEGLDVGLIAERIEKCLPQELLDTPAVVKVGVAEDVDSTDRKILDKYGEDAKTNTVSSSVFKHIRGDEMFCKWVLKFA